VTLKIVFPSSSDPMRPSSQPPERSRRLRLCLLQLPNLVRVQLRIHAHRRQRTEVREGQGVDGHGTALQRYIGSSTFNGISNVSQQRINLRLFFFPHPPICNFPVISFSLALSFFSLGRAKLFSLSSSSSSLALFSLLAITALWGVFSIRPKGQTVPFQPLQTDGRTAHP
jgi:hypothetical protein